MRSDRHSGLALDRRRARRQGQHRPARQHSVPWCFWGHAPNSQTRLAEMKTAMEKLDLLVVVDPYPTVSAVLHDRKDGVYLLPASTQFETYGSVTASNRSLQWREKVVEPLFESRPDHDIMYAFAEKFGFADEMFKNIAVEDGEPSVEDITREFNRGMWTIGYTGQSPERLKLHMANQHTFDKTTLRGDRRPVRRRLLRPALAVLGHGRDEASRHAEPLRHVEAGGRGRPDLPRPLRCRERDGDNLLAEGSYSVGSEIEDGYPEFTMADAEGARLGRRPHRRRERPRSRRWPATRPTGRPTFRAASSGSRSSMAARRSATPRRAAVVWTFPDPVPLHREPLYTPTARSGRGLSDLSRTRRCTACRRCTRRSRSRTSRRTFRSS